jgi:hypothetical protein
MEERLYFDGAVQNGRLEARGQPKDPTHVEEIPAEVNQRKERNRAVQFKHRKAKKQKRNANLSKQSDSIVLEPLQLIMGMDNRSSPVNDQAQGQSIPYAHRTILGHAARFVQ